MVNIDIPQKYAVAPTGEGTPHLTIHPEATIDLDSTNAFEGPEKLLEVWFSPSPNDLPASALPGGLKNVSAETWKEMLDLVNCKVLSVVSSEHLDAYLLSESSMFVFPHKLILKTCGTTTLLSGLPKMLEIAAQSAGFLYNGWGRMNGLLAAATPYRVFYSRKNFLYPDKQHGPHRSWRDEVRFLDGMFIGGSAYMVGKMNGEHWYLYITAPDTRLTPPSSPEWECHGKETVDARLSESPVDALSSHLDSMHAHAVEDETLEVLMTDLDPENAKQFYLDHASAVATDRLSQLRSQACQDEIEVDVFGNVSADGDDITPSSEGGPSLDEYTTEGHALGTIVSETCGLSEVYPASKYPDARIDAYLFTPCGFSANGVIPTAEKNGSGNSNSTHYFTVHVTPEPHCSYASFETNVPCRQTGRETADVVEQVVNIFRPGRFSVTLFEAKASPIGEMGMMSTTNGGYMTAKRTGRMECIKGYRRIERIVHDLNGYDLVFRYYEREDWKGGAAPRLGELSM